MKLRAVATETAKAAAARANLSVHRLDLTHPARRVAAMTSRAVDIVIDVGANRGTYVEDLRRFGYHGRVVSVEPIPEMFELMSQRLAVDEGWSGIQVALGDREGTTRLNVSYDTVTSSVLAAEAGLLERIPTAMAERVIEVPLRRLDDMWEAVVGDATSVMLKLDVQGYEHSVLDGLGARIDDITVIEAEMGLTQLYENGASIHDLLPRLRQAGFDVISIDSGFVDASSGQVLDLDVLMGRLTSSRC